MERENLAQDIQAFLDLARRITNRLDQLTKADLSALADGILADLAQSLQAGGEEALAEDLNDTRILHELAIRMVSEADLHLIYQEILSAGIALTHADGGTVQILDEQDQELRLLATRGFDRSMTDFFSRVDAAHNTSCGMALAAGRRKFLDYDDPDSPDPDGSLRMHVEAGYRSAQSTPLITRAGLPIGMISTHWRAHHRRPTRRELRSLDLLARQAADLIEQKKMEEALRGSEERFRSAIENINEGFAIITALRKGGEIVDFRYEYVNDAFCRIARRTREQISGKTLVQVFPRIKENGIFAQFIQVIASGLPMQSRVTQREARGPQEKNPGILDVRAGKFGDMIIITVNDITEMEHLAAAHRDTVQQREIQHRLLEQREQERLKIAHDLHDGPVQGLIGAIFGLQTIRNGLNGQAELEASLGEIQQMVTDQIGELRNYAGDLRPPSLDKFGLEEGIRSYLENWQEQHPEVQVVFRNRQPAEKLPPELRLALFRIYQELLANIARHARASRVEIHLEKLDHRVQMTVQDNGVGFGLPEDWLGMAREGHLGLVGVRERAEAIGGSVEIATAPGHGSQVRVTVPVSPAA